MAATLAAADVAVVNLETSIGEGGRPEPGKRFTFQAPASALAALAAAGVDVASMANNHALDFGREALPSTFAAIAAASETDPPLAVVGLGRDAEEAFRPARTDVDGTIVATIGATVADTDPTADPTGQWAATGSSPGTADAVDPGRLLRAVERAGESADVVVVYMHWGIQGQQCPSVGQRSLAVRLVERGADVVVGSHAHRLQGDGRLGEGYVALRARQLRLVHPVGRRRRRHRGADPDRAAGSVAAGAGHRDRRRVGARPHRGRRPAAVRVRPRRPTRSAPSSAALRACAGLVGLGLRAVRAAGPCARSRRPRASVAAAAGTSSTLYCSRRCRSRSTGTMPIPSNHSRTSRSSHWPSHMGSASTST